MYHLGEERPAKASEGGSGNDFNGKKVDTGSPQSHDELYPPLILMRFIVCWRYKYHRGCFVFVSHHVFVGGVDFIGV